MKKPVQEKDNQLSQDFLDDLCTPLEEQSTPIVSKETTPPKKPFFSFLDPEDPPSQVKFSAAHMMARIKKSKVDLSLSWDEENFSKIPDGEKLSNNQMGKGLNILSMSKPDKRSIDVFCTKKSAVTLTPPAMSIPSNDF